MAIFRRGVAIEALIANYMNAPGVSGTVRADEVKSGTTAVRKIDLDLSMEGGWTRFSGGAEVNAIPLKAAGRLKTAEGTITVELASAEGRPWHQGRPGASIDPEDRRRPTTLDRVALNVGGGSVRFRYRRSTLDLNGELTRSPASLANAFAPGLNAAAAITGTVHVTGAAADPNVAYSIDWAAQRPRKPVRSVLVPSRSGRTAPSLRKGTLSTPMWATAPA